MNEPIPRWAVRPVVALSFLGMLALVPGAFLGMLAVVPGAGARADNPSAPTIDSITEGENWLGVAWTAPLSASGSDVTAYDIRRIESGAGDRSDGNWTVVNDVWVTGGGGLLHVLTGLEQDREYDVQVRAVNACGQGAWSRTVQATPADASHRRSAATTLPLRTASNGRLHPLGNNRFPGNFDSGTDVDYYKIVVRTTLAQREHGMWFVSQGGTYTIGTLRDRNGGVLASTDDGVSGPHPENFFIWGDLRAGTYYLQVYSSGDAQGSYEIQVGTFPETSRRRARYGTTSTIGRIRAFSGRRDWSAS